MRMGVNQAGNDRHSMRVDDFGRLMAREDDVARPDVDDAVLLHDDRAVIKDATIIVHGDDMSVGNDEICHAFAPQLLLSTFSTRGIKSIRFWV